MLDKNLGLIVVGSLALLIGILSIISGMYAICGYFPVWFGLLGASFIWAGIGNLRHANIGRDISQKKSDLQIFTGRQKHEKQYVNDGLKGEKLVKCPECGRTLGTETEIRAMISRSMGDLRSKFNPGASILVSTFTTDCPFCHRKIPLSL